MNSQHSVLAASPRSMAAANKKSQAQMVILEILKILLIRHSDFIFIYLFFFFKENFISSTSSTGSPRESTNSRLNSFDWSVNEENDDVDDLDDMDEYSNSGIRKYSDEDGKLQPSMKKSKKVKENYSFFCDFMLLFFFRKKSIYFFLHIIINKKNF